MIDYQNIGNITLVSGDTFAVREVIKANGGRWNAASKVWEVPSGKVAALEIAINTAPKATAKPAAKPAAKSARPAYAARPAASGTCRARGCGRPVYAAGYCRSCGHDEI